MASFGRKFVHTNQQRSLPKAMDNSSTPYTRVYPRVPLRDTPIFLDGEEKKFLGMASDISRTGLLVYNFLPCDWVEEYHIKLTLSNTSITVNCRSAVIWCTMSTNTMDGLPSRRGLKFVDIDSSTANRLDDWVRSQLEPKDNLYD